MRRVKRRLEVHRHCNLSGPNTSRDWRRDFDHSHDDGSIPHQHLQTGPSVFTIDKDEWLRTTGLRGGGRKKFTVRPSGEQVPWVDLEPWQRGFKVVLGGPLPSEAEAEGPGGAAVASMALMFGMEPDYVYDDGRPA